MSQPPRSFMRPVAIGAAVVATGALSVLLLRGADPGTAPLTERNPDPAFAAAPPASAGRETNDGKAAAASHGAHGASEDDRLSRGEQYTLAFNRKLDRIRQRIAKDCAGNEAFVRALDDFDAVRDRIVQSAVATDRGEKTKAEQRVYERTQLQQFDAQVCHQLAEQSVSRECKRHFHSCDGVLGR